MLWRISQKHVELSGFALGCSMLDLALKVFRKYMCISGLLKAAATGGPLVARITSLNLPK